MSKFRRQLMMSASVAPPTPPQYDAEIEYLTFTENCRIDMGVNPSTNYKYYWKYLWESKAAYTYIIANNFSSQNWFMFGGLEGENNSQIHIKNKSKTTGTNIAVNTLYDCSLLHTGSNMVFSANNTSMVTLAYVNFTASNSLRIDCIRDIAVRFYGFSIYNSDDELLIDLIPVRVGQVGYMYDRISGTLKGNEGTGDFVLGNDEN